MGNTHVKLSVGSFFAYLYQPDQNKKQTTNKNKQKQAKTKTENHYCECCVPSQTALSNMLQ